MEPFTRHSGIAALLPQSNVDTDLIVPARFLLRSRKDGFADALFSDLRSGDGENQDPSFVLNRPPFDKTSILIAGDNFGCGSSREHAVWALLDFGIRVVIAPCFADIIHNNAFQNGLLVFSMPADDIKLLAQAVESSPASEIAVDLQEQTIGCGELSLAFQIDPYRKESLLLGLSETKNTLRNLPTIETFEAKRLRERPWLAVAHRG